MDEDLFDSIITNLKIIGMVQINEKLSIRKGHLCIDYSTFQCLKRWYYKDSREVILIFIKDLIRNINNSIHEKEHIDRILQEMGNISNGLSNLKTTYSDDPLTVVCIENIIIKFKEINLNKKTPNVDRGKP